MKAELKALNPINQNRKLTEWGALSESVNQKKSTLALPKSHLAGLAEPCRKCERTNRTISECQVGTSKCIWCGSPKHLITAYRQRLRVVDKGSHLKGRYCGKGTCVELEGIYYLWYGSY